MPIDPEELASQFAEEGRQAQALQGAFRSSVGVNPEEYVKAMTLAAKSGATTPTVMRNQEHFQTQAEVDEIDPQSLQEISPKLAAWLVAHEDNVPVAKGEIPNLQKFEGSARDRARKAMELGIAEANKRGSGRFYRFLGPGIAEAMATEYPRFNLLTDMFSGLGANIVSGLGTTASTVSDTEAAIVRATVGRIAGTDASSQALHTIRSSNPVSSLFRGLDIVGKKLTGWAQERDYATESLLMKDPITGEEFLNPNAANPATFQGQMNAAKIVAGELAPTAATIGLAIGTGGAGSVSAAPKVGRLLGLVKNIGKYAVSAPGLLEMARTVQGQFQNGVQFLMAKDPTLNQEDAEVKAAPGALLAGLLSGPTGAAMEGKIYNDLLNKATKAGAGNIVKRWGAKLLSLGVTGVKEGSQEVVQGFAEDLADWITVNPDKTLVQVAGNAIQNFIGGVAMGGGMHLAVPGGHGPDRPIGNIQELVDATKESKLLPRSPEKFREAVGNLLGDEKVLIEPEPFIEYFQSKGLDPYAMAEKVGVKNLDEALSSGNPLIMDTAGYLTYLAVEHHEGLAPDLRTSIGEWTPRMSEENATALEEAKTEMVKAQEALEVIEEPTLQEQIKADLVKKFDPLFEPSTARTYADAFSNILATLEIRSGQDLSKWREGLTVSRPMEGERGMSAEDVVVNRLKNTGPVSPELETLFQEDLAPAAESPTIQEGGTSGTLTKRETNTRGAVANSRTEAGQPGDVSEQPANQTTARERLLAERTKRRDFALSDPEGVRPSTVQADPGEVPNPHKAILQSSSTLDDIRAEKLAIPIDGLTPDGYKFRSDGNRIAVDGPNGEYVELVVHPHRALIVVDNVLVPEGRRGEGLGKRLYRRATQVIGNAYPEVRWVIGETASKEADAMRKSYPSTVTEGNTHITPIKEMMEGRSSKEAQGVGQTLYQDDQLKPVDTESPEFKKWFGDSKAIDDNGEPLILYHGTDQTFDTFDFKKLGNTKAGSAHLGMFFSSKKVATEFAGYGGARLIPVYLSIKNPLEIRADDFQEYLFGENERESRIRELNDIISDEIGKNVVSHGEDGVFVDKGWGDLEQVDEDYLEDYSEEATAAYGELDRILHEDPRDNNWGLGPKDWLKLKNDAIASGHDGIKIVSEDYNSDFERARELDDDNWIVFKDVQVKSAISNTGDFDPNNPNILFQNDRQRRARQAMGRTLSPSGQGAELNRRADEARMSEASFLAWEEEIKAIQLGDVHEGKQGFIQFGDNYQVHVGLLGTANLSTLIHEIGGHFAFEIMRDLAGQEGTPQQIKDDYAKILEAVGAENGVVGKDQHETFARLTEAYFMEGKAPSEELRGTFARVKEWMKLIYRQLRNLGVKLSPEVRTIFDRMYATDEAIVQARESAQETRKLIAKPEDVGWNQATFDRYQKTIAKSQERAAAEVEQKLIAEAQRQHESWWKDEEGKIRGEVEIAVDSRKDFKDLKALQRGQLEDGTPMKLDRAQIVALIGEKETQAISRSKGAVYVREGGVDIESAAEIMGYESGRQLVETLAGMPKRLELIERLTQEIMAAKHGDMRTDGTLADAAAEAIHNKAREEQLAMELQAFAAKAKEVAPFLRAQEKGTKAKAKGVISDIPPIATFRTAAVEIINGKKIMDIQPDHYLKTGQREGRKAFEAMGKQDFLAATQAKKNELMNHFLYLEAVKARALAEKQAGKARDLAKAPAQQRVGKAHGDYLNQMNSILDQYEFAKIPIRDLISRQTNREDWVKQQLEANNGEGTGVIEPDPILYNEIPKNYKELTPAELGAVMDMLNNIQTVARNQYRYMLGDREADFEAEKAEAISIARTVNEITPIKASSAYEGGWDRATRKLRGSDAEMQKMEWWIDQLDGGDINGPWRRNIKKRIDDATAAKHALTKETYALIRKAFESRPKAERLAEMSESSGIQFPNRNGELSRLELITFWANMGNIENEHVAIEGEGLDNVEGIATIEAARKAMRPGEWKFVQEIWDSLETLKAGLFATEKAMTGLEPIAKTLTPFDVKMEDGSVIHMRGGYFPLRADPILDPKGEVMEDPFNHLAVGSMKASTKTGAAQKVTGATYPLRLDYRHILGPHLDSVITRITLGEAVRDVSRFIEDPQIKRTIQETLSVETEKQFRPWLQDLGNVQAIDDGPMTRFLMKRRSSMVVANLIGNVGSLLVQGGDLPRPAMEILNWNPAKLFGVPGYAKAYFDIASNRKEMVELIKEMSPNEMRFRADHFQRDLREMREARGALGEANARVTEFLAKGFMVMDSIITFPAWLAKFRIGMDTHGDKAQAIMEADRLISRRVQAGEGRNMSRLFRRPGVAKLLTAFMGDSNTSYGIVSAAVHSKHIGRVLSAFMAVIFSQMIGKMLKNRGPGDDDDWLPWIGEQTAEAVFGMAPGVGDLVKLGMDWRKGKRAELRNPIAGAIVKPFELLKWTAENKEMDAEEFAADLMDAAGSWVGIPGTLQILRTWKYMRQVDEGKQSPENAWEAGKDAVLGPNPRKK